MKITKIAFGATANYGENYCTRAYYEAELEHWEDPDESINHLRTKCAQELCLPDQWHDLKHKFARQLAALEAIELKIAEASDRLIRAHEAWDNYAEFLTAHGVDPQTLTIENFAAAREYHTGLIEFIELLKYSDRSNEDDDDRDRGDADLEGAQRYEEAYGFTLDDEFDDGYGEDDYEDDYDEI